MSEQYDHHFLNAAKVLGPYAKVNGSNVNFTIQSGPVREAGENGCDPTEIIRFLIELYRSFNESYPCRENSLTITKLEEAFHWQVSRSMDRIERVVEGANND